LAVAGAALASPDNLPPPSGAILDLDGQAVSPTAQTYSVQFTAGVADTAITFAFRQDPGFETFTNASVIDLTNPNGNLLVDGDFSQGTEGSNMPPGWTVTNMYGASFSGVVGGANPGDQCSDGFTSCWFDGSVQAYDAISQSIATTIGDTYEISFDLNGGYVGAYSRLSTNGMGGTGGNGVDVLAYAQAGLPPAGTVGGVPEPASWALMIGGLGVAGVALRRRRNAVTA
jgi:hypothetical protein